MRVVPVRSEEQLNRSQVDRTHLGDIWKTDRHQQVGRQQKEEGDGEVGRGAAPALPERRYSLE